MAERDFLDMLVEAAHWGNWLVYHALPAQFANGHWVTPTQGDAGFPDLVLARGGQVLFREVKTDTGVLSAKQRTWGRHLGDAFGVWRPRDFNDEIQPLLTGRPR
jgi:hypothetical protein